MFGHRPDGRRVKKMDPIVQITPYLMPMRCDAQVFLEHKADYEKMSRYIARKSQEGQKITFMLNQNAPDTGTASVTRKCRNILASRLSDKE